MKIKANLFWGLKNGEIDTELMASRQDWNTVLKQEGRIILATFEFPKDVEFDIEFDGNSLHFQKTVDGEPRP